MYPVFILYVTLQILNIWRYIMFVVFDLETTGFSELNNDVIELAYIMFDDNNNFV